MSNVKPYSAIRGQIKTGDVIAFHYQGWFWRLVNMITRSPVSHVGLAVKMDRGLYVAEMQPGGNVLRPLSQTQGVFTVYPCPAVHKNVKSCIELGLRRKINYAFLNLIIIGLNHLLNLRFSHASREMATCGTFCYRILVEAGWQQLYKVNLNPSPAQLIARLGQAKFIVKPTPLTTDDEVYHER